MAQDLSLSIVNFESYDLAIDNFQSEIGWQL